METPPAGAGVTFGNLEQQDYEGFLRYFRNGASINNCIIAYYRSLIGALLLFHFVNLAKTNWKEAINIFYSESFHYILTGADRHYLPAYFGLSK